METPEESQTGYPEEAPAEVADDDAGTPQREGGRPQEGGEHGEGSSPATESDTD